MSHNILVFISIRTTHILISNMYNERTYWFRAESFLQQDIYYIIMFYIFFYSCYYKKYDIN